MTPYIDVQIVSQPVLYAALEPFPQPAGAEAVFLGRTRQEQHPEHGRLTTLSYEAYQPMAEQQLRELAVRACREHDLRAVRIHHAIGDIPDGAASVLVQVAAGHRDEAFAACRWLIDTLKETVPIWKREVWADGATWAAGTPANMGDL